MITIHSQSDFTISYVSSGMFLGSNWIHPQRTIDSYELLFVTKGEVYLDYNQERHVLCEGDAIMIYPDKPHGGYKISQGDTSFYWFHFLLSDPAFISGLPEVLRIEDVLKMKTLLNQLLDVTNAGTYSPYAADLITATILCEAAVQHSRSMKSGNKRIVNEIAEWIRINSDRPLTVELVSAQFGYNGEYLSRLFKRSFGIGLKKYIYSERIKAAKNLLISSYYSIKEIAHNLGWDNENLFIKFFKYHESVSPKKYRELYINMHLNKK